MKKERKENSAGVWVYFDQVTDWLAKEKRRMGKDSLGALDHHNSKGKVKGPRTRQGNRKGAEIPLAFNMLGCLFTHACNDGMEG